MPNRFPSKETRPTDSDHQVVLGDERYGLWQTVARELGLLSDAADVLWAGDGMGWVWRFTKGDVTLASLYPDGMCFTADFALGPDELASVGDDVGQEAGQVRATKELLPEVPDVREDRVALARQRVASAYYDSANITSQVADRVLDALIG